MPTDIVQHAADVALALEAHHSACVACRAGQPCQAGGALRADWQEAAAVFFLNRVAVLLRDDS